MDVETMGSGPRVVLVHGSVAAARTTWGEQLVLADRYTLVLVTRGGYPPTAPLERIDFEQQAEELSGVLDPGDHLVGHSYGGVVSLLASARRPHALASLAVGEPPAFGLARGHPAVEELMSRLEAFLAAGPHEPEAYLRGFLPIVGSAFMPPDPLPPELEQGARAAMAERLPSEASPPLADLARAPFPKLVVSGGHSAAFDAVCDARARAGRGAGGAAGSRAQRPAGAGLQRAARPVPRARGILRPAALLRRSAASRAPRFGAAGDWRA